jgi:hypothetical protein
MENLDREVFSKTYLEGENDDSDDFLQIRFFGYTTSSLERLFF